jgi:protein-S-isoprenylcysteine O-methyltransferase Ste14
MPHSETSLQSPPAHVGSSIAIFGAHLLGGGSLLVFGGFLWSGPLFGPDLALTPPRALLLDLVLSLLFFVQHSLMVRRWFRRRLPVPGRFHGVLYAMTSGAVLLMVVALWQEVPPPVLIVAGPSRWLLRGVFIASVLLFAWSIRSIRRFDGFGARELRAVQPEGTVEPRPLTVRGPYRWVRHPLYTGVLAMIWSFPEPTVDRLLFNLGWTAWMVLAAGWEENDLVADFGEDYRRYQTRVPMLLPWRLPADPGP